MSKVAEKLQRQQRRNGRVKARLGSSRPRLVLRLTNLHVTAQIIDDGKDVTLATSTSRGQKLPSGLKGRAEWVGADIAKKAKTAKITQVVFDRGSKRYHGRVKAAAEAARKNGLEF